MGWDVAVSADLFGLSVSQPGTISSVRVELVEARVCHRHPFRSSLSKAAHDPHPLGLRLLKRGLIFPLPVRVELVETWALLASSLIGPMPVQRAGAGSRPAASVFLLLRQKKGTKEKATLHAASLRFAAGNLRCSCLGCAAELTARLRRSVQTTAASQFTMRVSFGTRSPHALRSSAHPEGRGSRTSTRAIAALGSVRGRRRHAPRRRAERSDGPCGCPTPCWLRLRRGGCGVACAPVRACFVN